MTRLSELIDGLPHLLLQGDLDQEIAALAYDSRQVGRGSLFVCVRGMRRDGHEFIPDASHRGAVAYLVERDVRSAAGEPVPGTVLQVAETREALAHVAARFYGSPAREMCLVGITGTNGKTTVTYLTQAVLGAGGYRAGLIGTVEYRCGGITREAERTTPEASDLQALLRWMREEGANAAVMEVSSHALALHRVGGCAFDVAVFTNLTQDHLDFHGTMEAYFDAKAQLFGLLREKGGTAVINLDDPAGKRLRDMIRGAVVTYGLCGEADVTAVGATYDPQGVRAVVRTPWGSGTLQSPLLGRHNLYNLLAALGVAGGLGVPVERALAALDTVGRIPGRLEAVARGQPFTVVVDYAHSSDALESVLRALRELGPARLIVVFGCGGDRDRTKRPLMGEAAARLADRVVLTSDNPRSENPEAILAEIAAGIRNVPGGTARTVVLADRREAIAAAVREARPRDMILIAGKGHERVQIIGEQRIPFDDREVAREVMRQLGYAEESS